MVTGDVNYQFSGAELDDSPCASSGGGSSSQQRDGPVLGRGTPYPFPDWPEDARLINPPNRFVGNGLGEFTKHIVQRPI